MFKLITIGTALASVYGATSHSAKEAHEVVKKVKSGLDAKSKRMQAQSQKRIAQSKKSMKFDFPTHAQRNRKASSDSRALGSSGTDIYVTIDSAPGSCDNEPFYSFGYYVGSNECIKYEVTDDYYYGDDGAVNSLPSGGSIKAKKQNKVHKVDKNGATLDDYYYYDDFSIDFDDAVEIYYKTDCNYDATTEEYTLTYSAYLNSADCSAAPIFSGETLLLQCLLPDDTKSTNNLGNGTDYYYDDYFDDDDDVIIYYYTERCTVSNEPWEDGKEGVLTTFYEDQEICQDTQTQVLYYDKIYLDVCLNIAKNTSVTFSACAGMYENNLHILLLLLCC
jgi:hypothetical protein